MDRTRPAEDAVAVTPSDSTDLGKDVRGLYIGGAGDVAVFTRSGNTVTFVAVPVGSILPISVSKVLSTGTSASNIVALK